jgi:hypothetical protein
MMTAPGYKMYSLTHELFYLQIAEQVDMHFFSVETCSGFDFWQLGCLKPEMLPVTRRLTDEFCTNILEESVDIADRGFPDQHKDLFMEQGTL